MASSKWYQGPATLTLNSSINLGETEGGITVNVSKSTSELTADSHGDTPVRLYERGIRVEIVARLNEWDRAVVEAAFPSGSTDSASARRRVTGEFKDLTSDAVTLTVIPLDATHTLRKVEVPLAIAIGDVAIGFDDEEQQIWEVTFLALYDETNGYYADFFYGVVE